jgi:hypothetical protein
MSLPTVFSRERALLGLITTIVLIATQPIAAATTMEEFLADMAAARREFASLAK